MEKLWKRLEDWVAKHTDRTLELREPATEEDIAAAEKKIGMAFPADFRESLLVHDGQEDEADFEWMPGCSRLAKIDLIVERWEEEQALLEEPAADAEKTALDGHLHNLMYHPKRIPIAGTQWWDGDNTYLDLHPGPKGKAGQLITFVSEVDLVVIGPSFKESLERYVTALESGKYVYSKKKERVVPKGEDKNDDYPNEAERFALVK